MSLVDHSESIVVVGVNHVLPGLNELAPFTIAKLWQKAPFVKLGGDVKIAQSIFNSLAPWHDRTAVFAGIPHPARHHFPRKTMMVHQTHFSNPFQKTGSVYVNDVGDFQHVLEIRRRDVVLVHLPWRST